MTQKAAMTSYDNQIFASQSAIPADRWELIAVAPMLYYFPQTERIGNTEHSWTEDSPYSYTTALSATASAAATTWNVTAGTGTYFKKGDLILANSEVVRVTAISTDALTVDRAEQGTSAAIQSATGTTLYIFSNAQIEGADAFTGTYTVKSKRTNFCQIFTQPVEITGTDASVVGPMGDEWAYRKQRAMLAHAVTLDKGIKYGKGVGTGSATTARYMKGLMGWYTNTAITSSTIGGTTTSTAITKAKLDKWLMGMRSYGGRAWTLFCGLTAYGALTDAFAANGQKPIIQSSGTPQEYGFLFGRYVSAYGLVTIVMDTNARTGDIFAVESTAPRVTGTWICPFRPMFYQDLAKTGDKDKGQWLTEMTLESRNPQCSGLLTGVVTGA